MLVAGAGPAGCATAIGLRRLGYQVVLVHPPRSWPTCEGISARTREGLRAAGLHQALATVPTASGRRVRWNGEASAANTEHLLLRQDFDTALLRDAADAGISLLPGRVRQTQRLDSGDYRIHIETPGAGRNRLDCRFLVDARGRAAPAAGPAPERGPETVSLLQLRQGAAAEPGTWVSSFAGGWAWLATAGTGLSFVQLTLGSDSTRLPKRSALNGWFEEQLQGLAPLPGLDPASIPRGDIIARGSTSVLQGEVCDGRSLRVGDAAMAVDPLSGNGIFQSLSSALIAPAVINTLLQYPEDGELAAQFYRDRVRHTFLRFARMGRDFYRMEKSWEKGDFWHQRQAWPDDTASHSEIAPALLGVELRPVVAGDRICAQQVAVTTDQPLGIWHVAGVELAPLLVDLPSQAAQRRFLLQARLQDNAKGNAQSRATVEGWLRRYGLW